jgi:hypothetical protein
MRRKTSRAVLIGAAAAAVALFVGYGTLEAGADKPVGSISFIEGKASRKAAGKEKAEPLAKGTSLLAGDALATSASTKLEATLLDGSMLRLGSNSELRLADMSFGKDKARKQVKVKLVVGRVWAAVRSMLGGESNFEVETKTAVAGVRGTRFSATESESGETLVKVYTGQVLVSNQPIYAIKGHTKGKRVEVAGPQEISKNQWEELVASAMQQIRVAANGEMTKPEAFAMADASTSAEDKDWESWNSERDKTASLTE